MYPDANGVPDPARTEVFVNGAAGPVDLQVGPGGDLFYADLTGGTIRRVRSRHPERRADRASDRQPDERERPAHGAVRRPRRRATPTATR